MLIKHSIATVAVVVTTATSTATALADTQPVRTARAQTPAAAGVSWTPTQLQALANAYRAKNPGWRAPAASGVHLPADMTWTSENLDRLAAAYAALNPGWTHPIV